jgi:predicted DCC family thiol-disulfide oxidoreductase YuxK
MNIELPMTSSQASIKYHLPSFLSWKYSFHLVVFDSECLLCHSLVQYLLKKDTKKMLFMTSLQGDFFQKIIQEYAIEQNCDSHKSDKKKRLPSQKSICLNGDSVIFIDSQGYVFQKSDAVLKILHILGGKYQLLFFIAKIFPRQLLDFLYDHFAKRRFHIWGKTQGCLLLSGDHKDRIL